MRSTRWSVPFLAALSAQVASFVCLVVAYHKRDAAHAEGAYFNRSVGDDTVAVAFESDVRPWLVAAMLLTAASAATWLLDRALHRRTLL